MEKKNLVSGIKPTGTIHLGNYFGAIKQFVDLQEKYKSFVFIADYHALTSIKNGKELNNNTFNITCVYLACGLDPKNVTIYRQSALPEHTELTWIFDSLITMPWLMRAHAYKDAKAKNKELNVATFNYPTLMTADILMYDIDVVPVGRDQVQHIEMAREIASKFNNIYGKIFKKPKELIIKEVETVPGIDGQKMSKSYNNIIPIFGTKEEIKKAVMSIVTDSKSPQDKKNAEENNIFNIYKLLANSKEVNQMRDRFENGGLGYGEAKKILLEKIYDYFGKMKERYNYFQANPKKVYTILVKSERKMKKMAEEKMATIHKLTGLRSN